MTTTGRAATAQPSDAGSRLDFFVARHLSCGRRAAKRLIANGKIVVDGHIRPAHYKLFEGMEITLPEVAGEAAPGWEGADFPPAAPLVAKNRDYAVFLKPAGLHTARIAGGSAASLEEMLDGLSPPVALLSRLDRETSGLVAAAVTPDAAKRFRTLEAEGRIRKDYVALVRGTLAGPLVLRNALDTDDRKITRVLAAHAQDPRRFTRVTPLPFPSPIRDATVAAVRIERGARHQIRAHLAFAGHPIVGDFLYGGEKPGERLHLHHARILLPGLTAFRSPLWLPDFLEEFLEKWPCAGLD